MLPGSIHHRQHHPQNPETGFVAELDPKRKNPVTTKESPSTGQRDSFR
jgi:hypothetical protein